jgi:ATP-dependent DNA helicase RecG
VLRLLFSGYELGKPIEIQVWPDKIEMLSYPGAVPPVGAQIMKRQERIIARDYRNRRIGDFLKELELTEGRATGFPTIYKAMAQNGSPKPIFDTDDLSTKKQILSALGLSNQTKNKERHIDPLLATGWISFTIPENPTDRNQKYRIAPSGKRLLQLISHK